MNRILFGTVAALSLIAGSAVAAPADLEMPSFNDILFSDVDIEVEAVAPVAAPALRNYVVIGGGVNIWPRNSNDEELESRLPDGYVGYVAVGRHLTDNTRVGLEYAYRRNDVHGINPTGRSGPRLSGDGNRIHGHSIHGNVAYSFDEFHGFEPYVLFGLGVTHVRVSYDYDDSGREIDDSAWAASGQLGIGTRYNINERFALDLGYRYMRALQMEIEWEGNDLELNYDNHSLLAGLVVRF